MSRSAWREHTYRPYFDSQNHLASWKQLLTEEQFSKVREGISQDEVIDLIGVSTVISSLGRDRGAQ